MYTQMALVRTFEFGIVEEFGQYEVIAINNHDNQVRTLDFCPTLQEAVLLLETSITDGFQKEGMEFLAVPGFSLEALLKSEGIM